MSAGKTGILNGSRPVNLGTAAALVAIVLGVGGAIAFAESRFASCERVNYIEARMLEMRDDIKDIQTDQKEILRRLP